MGQTQEIRIGLLLNSRAGFLWGEEEKKKFHPSTKVFNPEGGCGGSIGRGPDVSISIRKGDCI